MIRSQEATQINWPKKCSVLVELEPFASETVDKALKHFHFPLMWLEIIPGVSLASEDPLHESFWWHPFDWQHCTATFPVIAGSTITKKNLAIIYHSEPPRPRLHVLKHYISICYLLISQTCKCLVPYQSHQFWQPSLVQDRWAGNF